MKKLLLFALLLISAPLFAAEATFTWSKPDPAFNSPPPPDWIIDEYRLYCDVDTGASWSATIPGYDTETYTATDLVFGTHTCYMTSFSAGYGGESAASAPVTTQIFADSGPNPPAGFDFKQGFRALITPLPDQ